MDRLMEEARRLLEMYEEGLTTRDELLIGLAELLQISWEQGVQARAEQR